MKRMRVLAAAILSTVVFCSAAETPRGGGQQTAQVTQLELAKLVVELKGLSRFLPPNPSPAAYFQLLMANGIAPAGGWVADQAVTRYDLARVVVLGMQQGSRIQNPENPQSWIDYLVGIGCRIDTIGLATKPLQPLAIPVGRSLYSAQPLSGQKPPRVVPSGDLQFGAIMEPIREFLKPTPSTATAPLKGARI